MENTETQNTRKALSSRLLGREECEETSVFDVMLLILAVLTLVYSFVQAFWISPVNIIGDSMKRTVYNDDWLIMDRLAKPERGDVVIIKIDDDTNYIKRIVGMPGDTLKIENWIVYLKKDGEDEFTPLEEPYVSDDLRKSDDGTTHKYMSEITLGENEIFFMGDNRGHSRDSRAIGKKTLDDVVGVVPEWSIKNRETIKNYYEFWADLNLKVRSFFGFR